MTKRVRYKKILNRIVKTIGNCAAYIYKEGWAEASGGNLSVDVSALIQSRTGRRGSWLLITRSGNRFRKTAHQPLNDVILIRTEMKNKVKIECSWCNNARPSTELPTHLFIHDYFHKKKSSGKVVIHTHPTYIIALTHLKDYCQHDTINRLLFSIHPEIKVFISEGVGYIPYLSPGSRQIADATLQAVKKHRIIIWEKHGCIAVADDLDKALDLIMIVEKTAKIFFIARSAGFDLQGLTEQQLLI